MDALPSKYLVIGNPLCDVNAYVTQKFLIDNNIKEDDTTVEFDAERIKTLWNNVICSGMLYFRCGGSGANVMVPLAKLSKNKCAILGRIGIDPFSSVIEHHFSSMNVESFLIKSLERPTGKVICYNTPNGERTMSAFLGATVELNAEDIDLKKLKDIVHVHWEGYVVFFNVFSKCVQIAANNNATTSMNLPTKKVVKEFLPKFIECIPSINYVFGNKEEIQLITGQEDIQQANGFFGINQTIAVTDGANGSWVKAQGEKDFNHYETIKVEKSLITNKTGAGDLWAGIFLALILQGKSVKTCVDMANLGAANWIQLHPGSHIADKTWETFKKEISMRA